MNIDCLGPETVADYYRRGLIRDVADLYDIQVQQINGEDGTREKSARKIVASIAESVKVPFERVVLLWVSVLWERLPPRHWHAISRTWMRWLRLLLKKCFRLMV